MGFRGYARGSFATRSARGLFAAALALSAGLASDGARGATAVDPPRLVPWNKIGYIALGASRADIERQYGKRGFHVLQRYGDAVQGYYRVHDSRVVVTYYGDRVGEIGFSTPYYRSADGFGVGSTIPLGPCHKTSTSRCERRWRGFVFNAWDKGSPCSCWIKVGFGRRSLMASTANFLKPWFFIYTRDGRVTRFYFALKFAD